MEKRQRKIVSALVAALVCLMAVPALAGSHKDRITGPIKSGPDATKQCLKCHESEARDFMKTVHWTWACEQDICDQKSVLRGKKNAVNNFCTSVAGNEQFCTKCHAGYGWKDNGFDFADATKVDCLVCHDTTGNYKKGTNMAGNPDKGVDLLFIAQNVGKPNRDNCGQCHFFGGGGDAVKHGDLDSSMAYPDRNLDVHMDVEGNDFQCINCHETKSHVISGNSLGVSPGGKNHFTCEQCHDNAPHKESRLNAHVDTVACQTCHIPYFAKQLPTKIWWDWSKAGEEREIDMKDEYGHHTYVKKKGEMKYGKMIKPEYAWYNGDAGAYIRGEAIDPGKVTRLAYPLGDRKDEDARIYPFKVMRGKQIYDKKYKNFITAKVAGEGGYWKDFDWDKAARLGSAASGLPYSGEYDFAETEMWWRINHMVAPKEKALSCLECHGDKGRMDWKALGYKGDPMNKPKWARTR